MRELYNALPEISAKSTLWFLAFSLVLVLSFRLGSGPSHPISYSSQNGRGSASAVTPTLLPESPEGEAVLPIMGGGDASDRGDAIEPSSPTVEPTPGVHTQQPVPVPHIENSAASLIPLTSESLNPVVIVIPAPVPVPSLVTNDSGLSNGGTSRIPYGMFRIFGLGGGGGSNTPAPTPEPEPAPPTDTVAPSAPIISSPLFPYRASSTNVILTGTAEAGATIIQNFSATTTMAASGDWSLVLVLPEGTTTVVFTAKDAANNVSASTSAVFFIDSLAPSSPVIMSLADNAHSSSTAVVFSGTGETGGIITQSFSNATTSINAGENWSLVLNFPQGTTTVAFTVTDAFGNTSNSISRTVVIDSLSPSAPIITSPSPLPATVNSADVVFSGSTEAGASVSQDFSDLVATANELGNWSLALTLPSGANVVNFTARDSFGNTSAATSASVTVSLVSAPSAPALTVAQCGPNSLSPDVCLSATTTLALSWGAVAGADYYEVLKNNVSQGTTTALSFSVVGANQATTTLAVSAHNAGGSATSTSQAVEIFTSPLIVNEVAWMGTFSQAKDEWIELYNRTGRRLSLSGVVLSTTNFSVPLSGVINPLGLYLLERTDDNTVKDEADGIPILADLIYGSDAANFDLNDGGDVITLAAQATIMDATPPLAACSGWCAGDLADAATMERVNTAVAGTVSTNWLTNGGITYNGRDTGGEDIFGTPKQQNATGSGSPVPI